jgi:hypothetical protein
MSETHLRLIPPTPVGPRVGFVLVRVIRGSVLSYRLKAIHKLRELHECIEGGEDIADAALLCGEALL